MRLFFALLFCGNLFGAAAQERLDPEEAKRALSASNRLYFLTFSHGDAVLVEAVQGVFWQPGPLSAKNPLMDAGSIGARGFVRLRLLTCTEGMP
jgi:hypothetical protein